MFTGIIEETGAVEGIRAKAGSIAMTVRAGLSWRELKKGASVAVNGCCLTVVQITRRGSFSFLQFDLLRETWRRTNLQFAQPGSLINLERPLRSDGSLGGHFVTGHIDGLGHITRLVRKGQDRLLEIAAGPQVMPYIVLKGSVAVDGVSLTVAGVQRKGFSVWIIPHTWRSTALRKCEEGAAVNLEADLLGKYVEKFVAARN